MGLLSGPIKVTDMWHVPSFSVSTFVTLESYGTPVYDTRGSRSQIWHSKHLCLWGRISGVKHEVTGEIWWKPSWRKEEAQSTIYLERTFERQRVSQGHLLSQSPSTYSSCAVCLEGVSPLPTATQMPPSPLFSSLDQADFHTAQRHGAFL